MMRTGKWSSRPNGSSDGGASKENMNVPAFGSVDMDPKRVSALTDLKRPLKDANGIADVDPTAEQAEVRRRAQGVVEMSAPEVVCPFMIQSRSKPRHPGTGRRCGRSPGSSSAS